jgi:hypothetical protein
MREVRSSANPEAVFTYGAPPLKLGLDARVYDGAHVEPTDESLAAAAEYARASGPWDAFDLAGIFAEWMELW